MSAGVQLTHPLVLGLTLEAGPALLSSGTLSCPITMRDASLLTSDNGADIGTTFPLALGAVLPTDGVANYGITSLTVAVPITMQAASLVVASPADVGTTFPLSLGLLLGVSEFRIVSDAFNVPIALASAEPSTFEESQASAESGYTGGWAEIPSPRRKTRSEIYAERVALGIIKPKEGPPVKPPTVKPTDKPKPRPLPAVEAERIDATPVAADWLDGWMKDWQVRVPAQAYEELLRLGVTAIARKPGAVIDENTIVARVDAFMLAQQRADEDEILLLN